MIFKCFYSVLLLQQEGETPSQTVNVSHIHILQLLVTMNLKAEPDSAKPVCHKMIPGLQSVNWNNNWNRLDRDGGQCVAQSHEGTSCAR